MRNWARLVDLGDVECVVRREGAESVWVDFWLLDGQTITCPAVRTDLPYEVLNALFCGEHEHQLVRLARKAWETVQATAHVLEEVEPATRYSFTGPSLDLLIPRTDSENPEL